MLYRLFISDKAGTNRTLTAKSTKELLTDIQSSSKIHNVVQVVLYEHLAEIDGIRPLVSVGSFASYFNGNESIDLLANFASSGRGLDLHNELNRLFKEQAYKQQWSA